MHPMLNIAVKAARRAGSIIERAAVSGVPLDVRAKRVNDFVTQVDRAAEEAVIDVVHKSYPDHAILAEESGETTVAAPVAGLMVMRVRWMVVPVLAVTP